MKKVKFKIAATEGVFEREGEFIEIAGQKFGLHKEIEMGIWGTFDSWVVTHLPSGMTLAYDLSRESAIALATKRLPDLEVALVKGKMELKKNKIKYPVNV